eukprot:54633-Pelagomonas_calceolata.AAC.7
MKPSDTYLRLRIKEIVRDDGGWAEEQGFKAFLQGKQVPSLTCKVAHPAGPLSHAALLTQGGRDTCQVSPIVNTPVHDAKRLQKTSHACKCCKLGF